MKIKIIKEFEGLPPVGTIIDLDKYWSTVFITKDIEIWNAKHTAFKLALEAGYAAEIKEQWQAWDRLAHKGIYWTIRINGESLHADQRAEIDCNVPECDFEGGCYFYTQEQAEQCLEKVKQTIREFHQEWKNNQ